MSNKLNKSLSQEECSYRLNRVEDALYAIGGKWKLRIILSLSEGNKRFNELQRLLPGISSKVLSHELKQLEINGFVKKANLEGTLTLQEYELTEYSDTLEEVVNALSNWGSLHRNKIKAGI